MPEAQIIPSITDARKAVKDKDYDKAETIYWAIIDNDPSKLQLDSVSKHEKLVESQESSIVEIGELYHEQKAVDKLLELLRRAREIMRNTFAKSKTAKVIKTLIDLVETIGTDNAIDLSIQVTKECIDWAVEEKRTFLRQSLQVRLAGLYYKKKNYQEALSLINKLVKEFRKLDDKSSLVEVQLLESKTYFQLKNFSKSRASLTSARTSANAIYCPSNTQAELDLMSGILHAEDKDFKTAYSYFFESFENYQLHESSPENDAALIKVLKYMLLCKIMLNSIDDVNKLLGNKNTADFVNNKDIEAMKAVSVAHSHRSLKELEECLKTYNRELTQDVIIRSHLSDLYDSLFQQNLLKLIEPYSCIEITHICSMIGLPKNVIESKLSNMILDKVFYGVLDQGNGYLIIYDEPKKDETYDLSLEIIKNMSNLVDLLYEKASSLD
ncbi:DEKNAAC101823 [Brettanomyces naardenensis]|uniref:DEKNAAC101823 n=1 Tax=Brettanomyces naardenensis TaxID=13370 RepID=A0A448YJ72_BRENA|nr:DEKNAAC101823 [Brettanomyces naardenensis]